MIAFEKTDPAARIPERQHPGDAAFDVYALTEHLLEPGDVAQCMTGLRMALPLGYAALVLPRSGIALKYGITVTNAPGLIDPNFRGELGVILQNTGTHDFEVRRYDRIAQLLVIKYMEANVREVESVDPAPDERGEGGFGSTGRAG